MKRQKDKYYKKRSHLVADAIASAIKRGNKKLLEIKTEIKKMATQININRIIDRNKREEHDRNKT